jgi:ATP-dependent Clp protease protease subunit
MIHQPLIMGTIVAPSTDLEIRAREIVRAREEINRILAHHTGQDVEKLAEDTDRDYFMSAEEARDYGLIDEVLMTTAPHVNGKKK